ncbi:MAG: ADP-ribosylglycohydrolase family protein [Tannerellaceae bacterium]|nr:ADP-ribosylglycohydrolase family protein [Tannerellaceae bacterium]
MDYPETVTFTHEQLLDKVKGGWAGQAIGVTFGSYTEFIHQGTFILDYQPIPWYPGYMKELMEVWPDLYDDIYMDLTFVDVFERVGLDAPVDSFAMAFAYADYNLWHANQAARYNIQHGIKDPGHWMNNPHADDLDYQIEADFAGIMSPGMPNTSSEISDKIGHIMNYGDGWYGGVFVGAMYSLAYISEDIGWIVSEALKTIPENTKFHQCIADVIRWHTQFPDDWHRTWLELQRHHAEDIGCPDGVFHPFNIDARINAAYIVLGLLYGEGNFTKTLEISTRAGQDSDCNPSNAAGILGTMYGYSRIPEYWMEGIRSAEDMDFKYTTMSMNKIYTTSFGHALETIRRNGGTVTPDQITIAVQPPKAVRYEQGFEDMYPVLRKPFHHGDITSVEFEFEGTGFVVRGEAAKRDGVTTDGAFTASLYLDGQKVETANFPTSFHSRRLDLFWKYQLPKGKHTVRIVVDEPQKDYLLRSWDYIIYSDQPVKTTHPE